MRFSYGQGHRRRRRGRVLRKRRKGPRAPRVERTSGDRLAKEVIRFTFYMECLVKMQGDPTAWCFEDVITCRLLVIIPLDTAIAGPQLVSEDTSTQGPGFLE